MMKFGVHAVKDEVVMEVPQMGINLVEYFLFFFYSSTLHSLRFSFSVLLLLHHGGVAEWGVALIGMPS